MGKKFLDFFETEKGKKIGIVFEVIGMAVGLTVVQLTVLYFVFKISVFEAYRSFFNSYLSAFKGLYLIAINMLSTLLGESILNNAVFLGMFMRMFFIIFAVNLVYFALSRYYRFRNKSH